jgi:hypothetical protein
LRKLPSEVGSRRSNSGVTPEAGMKKDGGRTPRAARAVTRNSCSGVDRISAPPLSFRAMTGPRYSWRNTPRTGRARPRWVRTSTRGRTATASVAVSRTVAAALNRESSVRGPLVVVTAVPGRKQ